MSQTLFTPHLHHDARVIIAALVPAKGDEDRPLIETVRRSVEANGAQVVATVVQRRGVSRARKPGGAQQLRDPLSAATVLGRGKVQELALVVQQTDAEAVIFCNHLTPRQQTNLEQVLGVPVLVYVGR